MTIKPFAANGIASVAGFGFFRFDNIGDSSKARFDELLPSVELMLVCTLDLDTNNGAIRVEV